MSQDQPPPGSFGLVVNTGRGGFLLRLGQTLIGDASPYSHAFMVLDNDEVIEATRGGARISHIKRYLYLAEGDVVFCDRPVQDYMAGEDAAGNQYRPFGRPNVEDVRREYVVDFAREMAGTPYNFATYGALGLVRLGITARRLRERIKDSGQMICSQLVDEAYRRAGIHLFDDGRLPAEVTPGDLDRYRRVG